MTKKLIDFVFHKNEILRTFEITNIEIESILIFLGEFF